MFDDNGPNMLAKGTHHEFDYMVRHNGHGYRCGYVKIPEGHIWHGRESNYDLPVNCHGGITYAEFYDEDFWIGFDCAHAGDDSDPSLYNNKLRSGFENGAIRSTAYCIEQCKSIIEQALKAVK